MTYVDPVGSPIPLPGARTGLTGGRASTFRIGTSRTGWTDDINPDEKLDTLGLRVIFAPLLGQKYGQVFKRGPLVFQCPPLNDFEEQFAFNHGDFMTAFAGERSRPGGRQLETISFDTLWLDDGSKNHAPDWATVKRAVDPLAAKEQLKALLYSGNPFWMMAHQMPIWHKYDLRMPVTMRSLTSQEKEGEADSRYFSLQVREWRDSAVEQKTQSGKKSPHGDITRTHLPQATKLIRTLPEREDSLYGLAKEYYGSVTMWQQIRSANGWTDVGPRESLKAHFHSDPKKTVVLPKRSR